MTPDEKLLIVANALVDSLTFVDPRTGQVVGTYPAPGGPDCMEVLAGGRYLMTTSRWAKKLTVIDTEKREVVREVGV